MKTIITIHLYLFCIAFSLIGNAQHVLIKGIILNEKTGNGIENVSILESYSGIGTISNLNGFFSLMLKKGNTEIVISHEGFKNFSKKLILESDTTLTVSLMPVLSIKSKPKEAEHQKTAEKIELKKNQ